MEKISHFHIFNFLTYSGNNKKKELQRKAKAKKSNWKMNLLICFNMAKKDS